QAERAAFIRTEIELALRDEFDPGRLRDEATTTDGWLGRHPWGREFLPGVPAGCRWRGAPVVRRGFPWSLEVVQPGHLFAGGDELLGRSPIEQLRSTVRPPDLRRLAADPRLARLSGLEFNGGSYGRHPITILGNGPASAVERLSLVGGAVTDA